MKAKSTITKIIVLILMLAFFAGGFFLGKEKQKKELLGNLDQYSGTYVAYMKTSVEADGNFIVTPLDKDGEGGFLYYKQDKKTARTGYVKSSTDGPEPMLELYDSKQAMKRGETIGCLIVHKDDGCMLVLEGNKSEDRENWLVKKVSDIMIVVEDGVEPKTLRRFSEIEDQYIGFGD